MTHQEACDLLMPCKAAMAEALTPVAQALVINKEIAKIAHIVRRGDVDRKLIDEEIIAEAEAYGFYADVGIGIVHKAISEGLNHVNGHDYDPEEITPTEYIAPDPSSIPKRQWLYSKHYIKGCVTATIAPGGFGKTTLALRDAIEMAGLGFKVWYISGEDDRTELDRRIAAHLLNCSATGVSNLFVDDKSSLPLKFAQSTKNGVEFDRETIELMEDAIVLHKIDVIILDPFISFHLVAESDNSSMDQLMKRFGEMCVRNNCCIELSHHVRKPGIGQFEITVYDARGAGAIVNAVRSCRVLNQMSTQECEQAQISKEHRHRYIRVDGGKQNMSPPEAAKWFHMLSIELPNGDNVQAMEPWEFPKIDVVTNEDIEWLKVTMKSNKGYRTDSRSPDWLGIPIARHFGRDVTVKGDVIWINRAIKKWVSAGIIDKEDREDEQRRMRSYYVLCEDK